MYILDTETASLQGGVVEIAWLRVDKDLNILDEFVTKVNPERPIDPGAFAVHGISEDDVKDAPTLEVVAKIVEPDSVLIGHNIAFDMRMVSPHIVPKSTLCTLALAKAHIRGTTNNKLETLQKELNLPQQTSHSALGDVHTCRDLLMRILELTGDSVEILVERASQPKMLQKMTFGKHKGVPILKVPRDYRDWLLTKELDRDMRFTLETLKGI